MTGNQKKNDLTTMEKLKNGVKLIKDNQSTSAGFTILFAVLIIIILFQII